MASTLRQLLGEDLSGHGDLNSKPIWDVEFLALDFMFLAVTYFLWKKVIFSVLHNLLG